MYEKLNTAKQRGVVEQFQNIMCPKVIYNKSPYDSQSENHPQNQRAVIRQRVGITRSEFLSINLGL